VALPKAVVKHIHRKTLVALAKQAYGFGNSHALMLSRIERARTIIELPFFHHYDDFKRVWIDLNQADKKFLAAILLGLLHPLMMALPFIYLAYLFGKVRRRLNRRSLHLGFHDVVCVVFLLILKSAALTGGRLVGALRYAVVCI
jgi:hypothetical protein